MIVAESKLTRRLVGRLARGADLLPALIDLCADHAVRAGEVRAHGALEEADLREFDQRLRSFRAPRRLTTPVALLSFGGLLAEKDGKRQLEGYAALSREGDNGVEVLGGQLVRGRVYSVEFVIDVFDDLLLRRLPDPATGMPGLGEIVGGAVGPSSPPAVAPPPAEEEEEERAPSFEAPASGRVVGGSERPAEPNWAQVAAASAAQEEPEEEEEDDADEPIRAGDQLDHPTFGPGTVERVEPDADFVHVRLRSHRLVRLSLEVLKVRCLGPLEPGSRKRRFQAMVKR